ncbi:hypothetical protein IG3_05875 [Bacillus cereus HuA2-1]|uniref:HTH hxlR-type domain-containing protein n=2 Tax=Bacillaceae TaxID=186817 RepID=J9BJJ5_BACCE|nr:hypothetical protein IG3_05875 [Bacillus cereus HuA2-1]QWI46988.1 cell division protein FtsZ [Bacillus mycoides]
MSNISMSSQEIIDTLCDTLNDGIWALRVLDLEGTMHKEGLWEFVNKFHKEYQIEHEGNYEGKKILPSRYSLDIMTARLEGAGLITFRQLGRVRIYQVSKLGNVVIKELEKRAKNNN